MASFWGVVFLLFRLVCYLALAVVLLGFGASFLLPLTGACSSISTGGVVCSSPFYKQLGDFSLGVMLITVYTGLPGLLALAGIYFVLRKIFLRKAPAPAAAGTATIQKDRATSALRPFAVFLLKGFGILLGISFIFGMLGNIWGGDG